VLDRGTAETYAGWFRALADPTRVQILNLLAAGGGPMTVGEVVERVDVGQSTVSDGMLMSCNCGAASDGDVGIEKTTRSSTRAISP